MMITAEEFLRNKLRELHPNREVITLANEMITAEQGLRWAHEFKQLHLHNVMRSVYECKVCGKPFGDKLSLYEHYDEAHNKQTDA